MISLVCQYLIGKAHISRWRYWPACLMTDRREGWRDGGSWRGASSRWAFNEVERLPGLLPPAVAPAKPRYLALALCPARATIPPNPLSEHVDIKAKHLPSRSPNCLGMQTSLHLAPSFIHLCWQNIKTSLRLTWLKMFSYGLLIRPVHSILQYLCFWLNGKIHLITVWSHV